MDSTGALELNDIPKTLLVVGGGYIGLELGTVYAALGSRVTVVEMMPGLLPGADRDLVAVLEKRVQAMCEAVLLRTKVVSMTDGPRRHDGDLRERQPGAIRAGLRQGARVHRPAAELRDSRASSTRRSKWTPKGFIKTDPRRRTAEPTLYAIGDVAGEPMLAHKASHEARATVEGIHGEKVVFDPAAIPAVVFTDPELAWCGLTEDDAKKQGRRVEIAKFPWGASGRATTLDRNDGLTKLVIEPGTERVLGVGLVGSGRGS